jgi:hypothetical protein
MIRASHSSKTGQLSTTDWSDSGSHQGHQVTSTDQHLPTLTNTHQWLCHQSGEQEDDAGIFNASALSWLPLYALCQWSGRAQKPWEERRIAAAAAAAAPAAVDSAAPKWHVAYVA